MLGFFYGKFEERSINRTHHIQHMAGISGKSFSVLFDFVRQFKKDFFAFVFALAITHLAKNEISA